MFPLCSKKFNLVRTGLMRAACPQELNNLAGNRALTAIVIVRNVAKFGTIAATGYTPSAVVIAGAFTRNKLMEASVPRAWAYVEDGAMVCAANDVLSCADFMNGLDAAMVRSCGINASTPVSGQAWPYIDEVFPFRNNFVYRYKDRRYKQQFSISVSKEVALCSNASPEIGGSFINAAAGVHTGNAKEYMNRVQTGIRYAEAPPRAQLQSFTTGGATSELITQIVRNWSNIQEAVAAYLTYIKTRTNLRPMRPAFYPVSLTDAGKIQSALAAAGVDPFDFAVWSIVEQAARRGKRLKASVGNKLKSVGLEAVAN